MRLLLRLWGVVAALHAPWPTSLREARACESGIPKTWRGGPGDCKFNTFRFFPRMEKPIEGLVCYMSGRYSGYQIFKQLNTITLHNGTQACFPRPFSGMTTGQKISAIPPKGTTPAGGNRKPILVDGTILRHRKMPMLEGHRLRGSQNSLDSLGNYTLKK